MIIYSLKYVYLFFEIWLYILWNLVIYSLKYGYIFFGIWLSIL